LQGVYGSESKKERKNFNREKKKIMFSLPALEKKNRADPL
jgi:hypothetical protein